MTPNGTEETSNSKQVGGDHYRSEIQVWDFVVANGIGYLEGNAIKYLARWRKKGGLADLEKAQHYIQKIIEVEKGRPEPPKVAGDYAEGPDGTSWLPRPEKTTWKSVSEMIREKKKIEAVTQQKEEQKQKDFTEITTKILAEELRRRGFLAMEGADNKLLISNDGLNWKLEGGAR